MGPLPIGQPMATTLALLNTRSGSNKRRSNVAKPEIAWQWQSPDNALVKADPKKTPWGFKSTPLKVGNVLYTSTSLGHVAINAATGEPICFDSHYADGRPTNLDLTIAALPIGRIARAGHGSSCLPTMRTCGRWMRRPANLFETLATLAVSI